MRKIRHEKSPYTDTYRNQFRFDCDHHRPINVIIDKIEI